MRLHLTARGYKTVELRRRLQDKQVVTR